MLYVKATIVGLVTGLLAVILPFFIMGSVMVLMGGIAVTEGGGIARLSGGIAEGMLTMLFPVGFIFGFVWSVWHQKAQARAR